MGRASTNDHRFSDTPSTQKEVELKKCRTEIEELHVTTVATGAASSAKWLSVPATVLISRMESLRRHVVDVEAESVTVANAELKDCLAHLTSKFNDGLPVFGKVDGVVAVMNSKFTRTVGPMMWQVTVTGLRTHVYLEEACAVVTFVGRRKHEVKVSELVARDGKPEGKHCAYCWRKYGGSGRCGLCRNTYYCGEACMTMHWVISHKRTCSRLFGS